jgi:hypothetical protein
MCKRKSWRKIRNPWKKIKDKCYVLENEKEAAQNEQYQFHTDLPPQPFQGNPEAPIWFLALNPGYSEETAKYPVNDVAYYRSHSDRRRAMLGQLKFKKKGKHRHYILDNEDVNYSKDWFKEHFFKDMGLDEKNVDDKIFILQAFGYASEKFNGNLNTMVKSFPHMVYAQKLARWGLNHGKIIVIARSCTYWQNVLEIEKKHQEIQKNVYFLSSNMNIVFSSNNILNWAKEQSNVPREQNKKESVEKLKEIIKE